MKSTLLKAGIGMIMVTSTTHMAQAYRGFMADLCHNIHPVMCRRLSSTVHSPRHPEFILGAQTSPTPLEDTFPSLFKRMMTAGRDHHVPIPPHAYAMFNLQHLFGDITFEKDSMTQENKIGFKNHLAATPRHKLYKLLTERVEALAAQNARPLKHPTLGKTNFPIGLLRKIIDRQKHSQEFLKTLLSDRTWSGESIASLAKTSKKKKHQVVIDALRAGNKDLQTLLSKKMGKESESFMPGHLIQVHGITQTPIVGIHLRATYTLSPKDPQAWLDLNRLPINYIAPLETVFSVRSVEAYRERTALLSNWGYHTDFYLVTIPPGVYVNCYIGLSAQQMFPKIDKSAFFKTLEKSNTEDPISSILSNEDKSKLKKIRENNPGFNCYVDWFDGAHPQIYLGAVEKARSTFLHCVCGDEPPSDKKLYLEHLSSRRHEYNSRYVDFPRWLWEAGLLEKHEATECNTIIQECTEQK